MDAGAPTGSMMLRSAFAWVSSLRMYLEVMVEDISLPCNHNDNRTLVDLLDMSLIATDYDPCIESTRFQPKDPYCSQAELVERARTKLFKNGEGKPSNVINFGYRMADVRGEAHLGGLSNFFTNTTADLLQTKEWQVLLERTGEDAMFHLLTTTSMFICLPNDCWCQVLGRPLSKIIGTSLPLRRVRATATAVDVEQPVEKRQPLSNNGCFLPKGFRPNGLLNLRRRDRRCATEIDFVRARIFYARAQRYASNRIIIGLPSIHILNRLTAARATLSDARHVLKYIFPMEYHLHNVFTCDCDAGATAYPFMDYTSREDEIKAQGPRKTPERLKMATALANKLLNLHRKCNYQRLCDAYCPSKVQRTTSFLSDSSVILEIMSEITQNRTQDETVSLEVSNGSAVLPHGSSVARSVIRSKPRFAEFTSSHNEIFRFVSAVILAVIPYDFWGSKANLRVILRSVRTMINARRFETINLHQIVQGFSLMACDWLAPNRRNAQRQCQTDITKRREMLEEFLYWFFDSFVCSLLKTTFYITESSAFRNRILYFRQDDWDIICRPLLDRLAASNFVGIAKDDVTEMMRDRKLGFSFVRLLPKETGVRPIVNLRRRVAKEIPRKAEGTTSYRGQPSSSINQILQAAFQILTFEKNRNPDLLGASVLGQNEIYEKLKLFKSRLLKDHTGLPRLYFVKVDVRACFDTIDQTKLLHILQQLVQEDGYMIQKYAQIVPTAGRMKRSYMRRACPDSEHPSFISFAMKLASTLRHAIFIDQVVYTLEDRDDVLELLREHVMENIVKIGNDFYRQTIGIPQGSVLSTILCSFFYGDLEQSKLRFVRDPGSLLLRYIDDFLFITVDKSKAISFLDVMNIGHPEYGCFISQEKTTTNFDQDDMDACASHCRDFAWCGLSVDTVTLEIKADYSRLRGTHMSDTLTIARGKKPGTVFRLKLFQAVKQRSHIIFNDTSFNSLQVVHLNIYQNFLISGMKMHAYVQGWGGNTSQRQRFILDTILQSVRFAYFAIRNKSRAKLAIQNNATCLLEQSFVTWLGLHAFHYILSQRSVDYRTVLKSLRNQLSSPMFAKARRRLTIVTKAGINGLALTLF